MGWAALRAAGGLAAAFTRLIQEGLILISEDVARVTVPGSCVKLLPRHRSDYMVEDVTFIDTFFLFGNKHLPAAL